MYLIDRMPRLACAAGILFLCACASPSGKKVLDVGAVPTKHISFETDEGTWMSVDVSPDGETLVFDLLGDLYLLPITGGEAAPLTTGMAWDQGPRFSPDGKQIYFVSDRKGYKNLWRLTVADQTPEQVTHFGADILGGINWAADGKRLLVGVGNEQEESILHAINPKNGEMTPVNEPQGPRYLWGARREVLRDWIRHFSGVEAVTGKIYYSEVLYGFSGYVTPGLRPRGARIVEFDLSTELVTAITPDEAPYHEYKPQVSRDGALLAYFRQYSNARTELRVRELATGGDRAIADLGHAGDASYITTDDSRANYAFLPDSSGIVFSHNGKIHRLGVNDGTLNIVPFRVQVEREVVRRAVPSAKKLSDNGEASAIRWPNFSQDGQTMVFAAVGYIWSKDLDSGVLKQLTPDGEFAYMPALSPDGKFIAYISFKKTDQEFGSGRLITMDSDGTSPRELLSAPDASFILPNWSQDGTKIALIQQPGEGRGQQNVFGWTLATKGEFNAVAAPADLSRFEVWWPNAYYVGFNETGDKLLLSYPTTEKSVLLLSDLAGYKSETIAIATSELRGIAPSPDLSRLALTHRDGSVWVVPFGEGNSQVTVSSLNANTQKISDSAAFSIKWRNNTELVYGLGTNVHRYDLEKRELTSHKIKVSFESFHGKGIMAFRGARLLTMAGEIGAGPVIENGTIVIDHSRIVAMGPTDDVDIPTQALVINAKGKTIMPGFLDTHYHSMAADFSALGLPGPRIEGVTSRSYGITAAWNAGGGVGDSAPAVEDFFAAGRIIGPRWSHGAGLVGYHGGGMNRDTPYEYLDSYPFALAAVVQRRELGADILKEYNAPTRQQRQWLASATVKNGLGIVSHLESFDQMMTLIVDGYTGGDHPHIPTPLHNDVRQLLVQTGYIWTPNLWITVGNVGAAHSATGNYSDNERDYFAELAKMRPHELVKFNRLVERKIEQLEPFTPYETRRISRMASTIADAARVGARIGVSGHNKPGFMLHMEMWHLWKGGMPIADVLRAATMTNAEKLGLQEEIGSLEVGKLADFLVLDENPLDDIINTLSIKYTVQGGVIYDANTAEKVDAKALLWQLH